MLCCWLCPGSALSAVQCASRQAIFVLLRLAGKEATVGGICTRASRTLRRDLNRTHSYSKYKSSAIQPSPFPKILFTLVTSFKRRPTAGKLFGSAARCLLQQNHSIIGHRHQQRLDHVESCSNYRRKEGFFRAIPKVSTNLLSVHCVFTLK